ncbi:MAG: DUF4350 domain-containing protein [Candidatus Hodarchaeales archaeon]|jgi:hypothetical protein
MAEINKTTSALVILAVFISYPFVSASMFGFLFTNNSTNFSIYNKGWNGASTFKDLFVEEGAEISTIVGSSNVLNRLNQTDLGGNQGSLIILGPSVHYDFSESLAILMYAINGGRVIIADDFGTGNDILSVLSIFLGFISEIDLGSMGFGDSGGSNPLGMNTSEADASFPFPIAGIAFNGSLLADQGSYDDTPLTPIFKSPSESQEGTTYKMPAPWVTDFTSGLSGNGVIGNFASIITMKVRYPDPNNTETNPNATEYITKWVPMGEFPASAASAYENLELPPGVELPEMSFSLQIAVLYSSTQAWMESDISSAKADVNSIEPNLNEWGNPNVGFPVFVYFPFPLGGQIILCSDPSIFINQYLDSDNTDYPLASQYDNRAFADNVIRIMMNERPGQTIIFDEGHLANSPISPIFPLSLYLKFLDMITMFPLFAIFLVPIAVILSRKFIPRKTQAKPLLLTRVERYYGRSFFAVKMRWFLEYRQYSRGLELILRRLKRNVIKRYSPEEDLTPDVLATYLINEFPESFSYKNLVENFSLIETIVESRSLISEEEFLDHYFFIKNVGSIIS